MVDFIDPRHAALRDKLLDVVPFGDDLADDAMGVFCEILRGDCHRFCDTCRFYGPKSDSLWMAQAHRAKWWRSHESQTEGL